MSTSAWRDAYLGFEIKKSHLEKPCPLKAARLQLENGD